MGGEPTMMAQLNRRRFLIGSAAVVGGVATGYGTRVLGGQSILPEAKAQYPVHRAAHQSFLSGVAIRPDQIETGSGLPSGLLDPYDLIVPEYHGQWSAIEYEPGKRWFDNFDRIVAYAQSRDAMVRGHALIWENMTPNWVRTGLSETGGWSLVHNHFDAMLSRYRDSVPEWVVVNECVDTEDGVDDMRQTSFQRAFGNGYVERAFRTAREMAPNARLMVNEYGLEYDNPVDEARRDALLRLVERLKAANVPLDVVGLQAHLDLSKGRLATKAIAAFCRELAAMDVDIAVTELDVLEHDRSGSIDTRDRRVADEAQAYLDAVLHQPRVRSVATWGLSDRDSWLQERSPSTKSAASCSPVDCTTMNRGLPYDGEFAPKPMASVVDGAILSTRMRIA